MTIQGKELFDKHAAEWLVAQGQPAGTDPIKWAITTGKAEILDDVQSERVPVSVKSFSGLHDYVDANYYGKAFDWPVLPSDTEDNAYQEAFMVFWNKVQRNLHEWVASGNMRKELPTGSARQNMP
jgi:hypothetical protein